MSIETLDLLKNGQLKGLKELKLTCLGLTEFPEEIFDLADSLEFLNLSDNCLTALPADFSELTKLKVVFFNNNCFAEFPEVLAGCSSLSMVSFKNNQIVKVSEHAFSSNIRWLILTNNRLKKLPKTIGNLKNLQKCMLAGNQLETLPEELGYCQNIELLRVSANLLHTFPAQLLELPRLAWLAYSGNPCTPARTLPKGSLPLLESHEIEKGELLGEGASGMIYKGNWISGEGGPPQVVAIKIFKGKITSDGSPIDEMGACLAAGSHPNLAKVLGRYSDTSAATPETGLVFSFISADYYTLGNPPSLETCTRDTYAEGTSFKVNEVLQIASDIASVVTHLHARGISHGDLYAHNILVNKFGRAILGDFGAASFYNQENETLAAALEKIESRAFGCLLEDLLDRTISNELDDIVFSLLRELQRYCMNVVVKKRPLFAEISSMLRAMHGRSMDR